MHASLWSTFIFALIASSICQMATSPLAAQLTAAKQSPHMAAVPASAGVQASKLSMPEIEDLYVAFRQFDIDGRGYVDGSELGALLIVLGEDKTEESLQMKVADSELDIEGTISFDQLLKIIEKGSSTNADIRSRSDSYN